jgi:hypothetical protein
VFIFSLGHDLLERVVAHLQLHALLLPPHVFLVLVQVPNALGEIKVHSDLLRVSCGPRHLGHTLQNWSRCWDWVYGNFLLRRRVGLVTLIVKSKHRLRQYRDSGEVVIGQSWVKRAVF